MFVCECILTKDFSGINMKEAYLKGCKWYSSHVLRINNSKNIVHRIEKLISKNDVNGCARVRLSIYVCADESEIKEKHCEICQEVSGAFFMAKNKHMCESCKMLPYRRRLEDKVQTLKEVIKGVLESD